MTESAPVGSITLPPSTAGTTRSRSVIASKLSSSGFVGREGVVQLYGHADRLLVRGLRDICSRDVIEPGTHRFGPSNATLSVQTRRGGAAAKAGHDLLLHVTAWEAHARRSARTARRRPPSSTADATSLRVQEGTGGMQALDDDDKANIHQTIDDEVLKRRDIAFRSTAVEHGRRADASRAS